MGLQAKSALVLAGVVLAATAAGGWLYYLTAGRILRQNDRQQADHLAKGLVLAVGDDLARGDRQALQRQADELLAHPEVHYVCIVDRAGKVMARAERWTSGVPKLGPTTQPVSLSFETTLGADFLDILRPVVAVGVDDGPDVLLGSVRMILDTRQTSLLIQGIHRGIVSIAAIVALGAIPLGHLLVWRVLVVPIRRLVSATRRLGEGDYAPGLRLRPRDEIGELASAFDAMAGSLQASQRELRQANEMLEAKVAQRTGELEQANHRLREEMSEKEDFLRAVSHDLNAPLRNIDGMAALIAAKWSGELPAEVLTRLQRIQANVQSETELLGELLELSRIKSRPQKRHWVDLKALLRQVRESFEFELKQKNVALNIGPDLPTLYVERSRLREVFQNLIDNAIKYMGARSDGRIDVGYRRLGEVHRFSVTDNGPGIAPAEQQRIFRIFSRVSTATSCGVPGKGIGLAVVKSIVSNYDGRVWVESHPPGGSVFHVELRADCLREGQETVGGDALPEPVGASAGEGPNNP
jgi:signal transduction histidine kinase